MMRIARHKLQLLEEAVARRILALCALVAVAAAVGIIFLLTKETGAFLDRVTLRAFLGGTEWSPMIEPRRFGVLPLVCGTLIVTVGAALIAIPFGLGTAIYLNDQASLRQRNLIKPLLELLAGVPTVVYGFFALTTLTPLLQHLIPALETFNGVSAAIVVGIMTLPQVASLCDEAIRAVPRSMRDGAYALGATRLEVTCQITLPAAMSGIIAAFILALARAFGETMAVTLAAGSTPKLTLNPLGSIQTMTAYIVQASTGDVPHGSLEYQSIFAIGGLLFCVTLVFNLAAFWLVKRFHFSPD